MAKRKTTKKTTVEKRPKTHVAFILDRSSSMSPIWAETISGFNNQVKQIQDSAKEQDVRVTFVTFSGTVADIFFDEPAAKLEPITPATIIPYGNTAMFDAVGLTLERLARLESAKDPEQAFLVIVMSDGEENASCTFSSRTVAPLVTALQNSGRWTFTYMGANQDLTKVVEALNIPSQNTMVFRASSAGVQSAWNTNMQSTQSYMAARSMGAMNKADFFAKVPEQNAKNTAQAQDDLQKNANR